MLFADADGNSQWAALGAFIALLASVGVNIYQAIQKGRSQDSESKLKLMQEQRADAIAEAWEHAKQLKAQHKIDLAYIAGQYQASQVEINNLRATERDAALKVARLEEQCRYQQQEITELKEEIRQLREQLDGGHS